MERASDAAPRAALGPRAGSIGGPILVATDGREPTAAALAIAQRLAERSGAAVEVASVLEPLNVIIPSLEPTDPPVRPGASRVEDRRARLTELTRAALGAAADWPVEIALGDVVPTLARVVRERGVRLVVTGHVHHGLVERTMRGETPLGVARAAQVPVLAVPSTMTHLPRIVVVAMGQGTAGARAAAVSRLLLGDAVEIHLVHVRRAAQALYDRARREEDDEYEETIQRSFEVIRRAWNLPADVAISTHVLLGRPVDELLRYADRVEADLLVAGLATPSHRLPARELAVRLFHESSRAMLLVPVSGRVPALATDTTVTSVDPLAWADLLGEFTRRNARRVVSLVVEERRAGARIVARRQKLVGVEYDAHDRELVVLLGASEESTEHLTHRVPEPIVLAVHRRSDASDDALVVGYPDGQLLLSLE